MRTRIVRIPVVLRILDDTVTPTLCEACFFDANGDIRRVVDKEPIFRDGSEPVGIGTIACLVVSESGEGSARVLKVSLATPLSLLDDRGQAEVEILARNLRGGAAAAAGADVDADVDADEDL